MFVLLFRNGNDKIYCGQIYQYDEAKVNRIFDKAKESIPRIAQDIMTFTPFSMPKSPVGKSLAVIGRAEWLGARIVGKLFYAKSGCTRCGKCVDNCPNHNIALNQKSVVFKWRCGLCMRCICQCPKNLITIRQPFRFLRLNQWYNPEIFK